MKCHVFGQDFKRVVEGVEAQAFRLGGFRDHSFTATRQPMVSWSVLRTDREPTHGPLLDPSRSSEFNPSTCLVWGTPPARIRNGGSQIGRMIGAPGTQLQKYRNAFLRHWALGPLLVKNEEERVEYLYYPEWFLECFFKCSP